MRVREVVPRDGAFLSLEGAHKVIAFVMSEVVRGERADLTTMRPVIAVLAFLMLILGQAAIMQLKVKDFLIIVLNGQLLAPAPILLNAL